MPLEQNMINDIVHEYCSNTSELPWVEFKENNYNPQEIGEYVSALSNTAAIYNKGFGTLIWGINNQTHELVGTSFEPRTAKYGNESLELWISTQLSPQVQFYFHETEIGGKNIVMLEIAAAYSSPVKFRGIDYIRIGSHKKKLKDFPDTERELWAFFSKKPFEELIAAENVSGDFVLRLLDYSSYFDMLSTDLPSHKAGILERLYDEKMITKNESGNSMSSYPFTAIVLFWYSCPAILPVTLSISTPYNLHCSNCSGNIPIKFPVPTTWQSAYLSSPAQRGAGASVAHAFSRLAALADVLYLRRPRGARAEQLELSARRSPRIYRRRPEPH